MKNIKLALWVLVAGMAVGACSKKKAKEDADAGDVAMAGSGAYTAGAKIPELGPIYFEFDSFALTFEARSILNQHATWLKNNPTVMAQVEGHTDERGTTEYNLALGERRAASVRDYLVSKGVAASQVSTISYGEERPAAQGSSESAWAQNRRTEFVSAGY